MKGQLLTVSRGGLDVPPKTSQNQRVDPLARLIRERMQERGWSYEDVGRQGDMPSRTVLQLANPRAPRKQTPRPATLESLAAGLHISLTLVQRAAAESVGYKFTDAPTSHTRTVMSVMGELDEDQQRRIAEFVLSMAESWAKP